MSSVLEDVAAELKRRKREEDLAIPASLGELVRDQPPCTAIKPRLSGSSKTDRSPIVN